MTKKNDDAIIVESKKRKGRADILSCNPREETVKVRAKTKEGKETTKTVTIGVEKRVSVSVKDIKPDKHARKEKKKERRQKTKK